jgi:poly(3-hydroxyalkanoate) synthetase
MVGPLNFWAGDGIIKKNCQEAGPEYFEQVVEWNGGMQPGYAQWLGFASMAPHYFFFERYANLFWGLVELNYNQNPKPVDKWIVERNWMDAPRNLPGPWYKRVTRDLFIGNKLVRGLLKVKGKIMDMAKVKWRILAIAGGDDEITPPPQLDIREYLPKGSSFEMVTLEGHGHTKPLFSSESMKLVVAFLERALSSSQKTLPAPNAVA